MSLNLFRLKILILFIPCILSLTAIAQKMPNIVIILLDDLGYGDVNLEINELNVFKKPYIKTPHLAKFAQESLVFTDHYSASPVCSPSRAGLLTGRVPARCNINLWINDHNDNDSVFLSGKEITIPELLKTAGYETAVIGKWHLNGADWLNKENWTGWTGSFPKQQGFDYAIVSKENPHKSLKMEQNSQKNPGNFFDCDGNPLGVVKGYSSQIVTDWAIEWLNQKRNNSKPFFLYLSYDAVHERIMNPPEYNAIYNTGDSLKNMYYANVTYVDHQIGRFLDILEELDFKKNTIFFFSSDNGPEVLNEYWGCPRSYGTSYPFFGQKRQVLEGGIRVPGIVRWPERIKPGISNEPNSTMDLLPTFCELSGVEVPNDRVIDGESILNHLLNNVPVERISPFYWQLELNSHWKMFGEGYNRRYNGLAPKNVMIPRVAIRQGDYVLRGYHFCKAFEYCIPESFALFNIRFDMGEEKDLSKEKPEVFNELVNKMLELHKDINHDRMDRAYEIRNRIDQSK